MDSFGTRPFIENFFTNRLHPDELRKTAYFKGATDTPSKFIQQPSQSKHTAKQPLKIKPIKCPVLAAKYLPKEFFSATPVHRISLKNPVVSSKRLATANDKTQQKCPPLQLRIKKLAPLGEKTSLRTLHRKSIKETAGSPLEESLLSYSEFIPVADTQRLFTADSSSNKKEEKKRVRKILNCGMRSGSNHERFSSYRQIAKKESREDVTFGPLEPAEEAAISNASTSGSHDSLRLKSDKKAGNYRKVIRTNNAKSSYINNI
eukprot:TRINITY_DN12353_c0_g1_i5.p1 TRINITY_DN12353_c0_g1~~TRINITY_DN12353_c0_g1_i5.p1  ORF type:complete len:261 (+),score=61.04 TRINITY_DN12353_c0_g1_i5:202-984(+)